MPDQGTEDNIAT